MVRNCNCPQPEFSKAVHILGKHRTSYITIPRVPPGAWPSLLSLPSEDGRSPIISDARTICRIVALHLQLEGVHNPPAYHRIDDRK